MACVLAVGTFDNAHGGIAGGMSLSPRRGKAGCPVQLEGLAPDRCEEGSSPSQRRTENRCKPVNRCGGGACRCFL